MRRSIKNRQSWKEQGLNNSMRIYKILLHQEEKHQRWGRKWADSMVPDLDLQAQRDLFAWRRKKKLENRRKS